MTKSDASIRGVDVSLTDAPALRRTLSEMAARESANGYRQFVARQCLVAHGFVGRMTERSMIQLLVDTIAGKETRSARIHPEAARSSSI